MTAIHEHDADTIAAIATPPGEGGIGIVRLSGPQALAIAGRLFRARGDKCGEDQSDRTVRYGKVMDGERMLDEALLLVMRAPKTFTGEDVAEIQAHGGPAVLRSILELALRHGARAAAPGEFTKRAFLHGRIDLVQAEAVLDLIQARTERGVRLAASQLDGRLARELSAIKAPLLSTLAHLEAAVDFPDDHPETETLAGIDRALEAVERTLRGLLEGADLAILAKRGLRVVIWGRPNVGKSSLLNALTRLERAIVTPHPGTTRDIVEEETVIDGYPVRLVDTAGVQDTEHPIEKEGIERSRRAMASADLLLFVVDASRPWTEEDQVLADAIAGRPAIVVMNKSDLPEKMRLPSSLGGRTVVAASSIDKPGVGGLRQAVLGHILAGRTEASQEAAVQSARQKEHLQKALENVAAARKACAQRLSYEFIASDVRLSLDQLGRLVGEIYNDEMLDILFGRFCIGK